MTFERKENESDEELLFRLGNMKDQIGTWLDIADIMNSITGNNYSESKYRKDFTTFQKMFDANKMSISTDAAQTELLKNEKDAIRKERYKLQTLNLEKNRIDRSEARQELFYEYIGQYVRSLDPPEFSRPFVKIEDENMDYLLTIADMHMGSKFIAKHNSYSIEEAKNRMEWLLYNVITFIQKKNLSKISILNLGDSCQGLLRVSDIKINEASFVKAVVESSRLIGSFLNSLSKYVDINYYHVPNSNHGQIRLFGVKANEMPEEDVEYIVINYIKDLCANNNKINVISSNSNDQLLKFNIGDYKCVALHGNTVKMEQNLLNKISSYEDSQIDYVFSGHLHTNQLVTPSSGCTYDREILVCPSFVGPDNYSDRLMLNNKAASNIYGFNDIFGHTETYKIILN